MANVAVIMSTYNGQKYIKEQIISILNQDYSDFEIIIRDDGSTDDSFALVESMSMHDSHITSVFDNKSSLDTGNTNIGFGGSFSAAAKYALEKTDCKYIAFCDQDDYWEPNKLSEAIAALSNADENKPALFASNYYICDQDLNVNGTFSEESPMKKVTFQNMFFEGVFPGFTIVINRKLAELAFSKDSSKDVYYHDKWVSLIALGLGGTITYSPKPLAKYRRHDSAASSTNLGFTKKLQWRINKVLNGDFCPRTHQMLLSFNELFADQVSTEIKDFLQVFTGNSKLRKLTYPKHLRRSPSGELLLRIIILLGKL